MVKIEDMELVKKRYAYYTNLDNILNIVKVCKDREVVFMSHSDKSQCIRGMLINHSRWFKFYASKFGLYDEDKNIYVSCATYKKIPYFPLDLNIRSRFTQEWFQNQTDEGALKNIVSFDILIDFDFKKNLSKINEGKREFLRLCEILQSENIFFYAHPSSYNGFHIVLKGVDVSLYEKNDFYDKNGEFFSYLRGFLYNLKERFSLKFIDIRVKKEYGSQSIDFMGADNPLKIRKCEYSLVGNKDIFIVLPHGLSYNLGANENAYNFVKFSQKYKLFEKIKK